MAGVKQLPSGTWRGWFKHYDGERVFFTLTPTATKRKVLAAAQELELQHKQIRLGLRPRPDQHRLMLTRPIAEVIQAYLVWGQMQGGPGGRPWTPKHHRTRGRQLRWWQATLHLQTLDDCRYILPSVERLLQDRASQGWSSQTLQHERNALMGFLTWCVKREYLDRHPLRNLSPIAVVRRTERRALTAQDIRRLLDHCPPARRLLYEVAVLTGLRLNELRQLSLTHLDLDRCGLHLDALWTKNRKPGFLPLPGEVLGRLYHFSVSGEAARLYTAGKTRMGLPSVPLLYVPHNMSRYLAGDLDRVGIPRKTAKGKVDFHAIRKTFINLVYKSGATPPETQELARHRTAALTLEVYGGSEEGRLRQLVQDVAAALLPGAMRAPGVHAQVVGSDYRQESQGETGQGAPLHWLPTSMQSGEAMARRRKEERRAGSASRGMVRRWSRFSSRVRHRGVPAHGVVPEWCHASGAAGDVCSDAPAWAQRAERGRMTV